MVKRLRKDLEMDAQKRFEENLQRVAEVSGLSPDLLKARYFELLERSPRSTELATTPVQIGRKRGAKVTAELDEEQALKFSAIKQKLGLTSNAAVVKALIDTSPHLNKGITKEKAQEDLRLSATTTKFQSIAVAKEITLAMLPKMASLDNPEQAGEAVGRLFRAIYKEVENTIQ